MYGADHLKNHGVTDILNYNRKSRQDEELERKTGEDTLKTMRDLMDRVLTPIGIPFVQEDELGSGDKISTRPVFQKVLEQFRAGLYQAIAVKEISRMGRGSYTDMGIVYDLIVEKRIFVITPWRIYDPKNAADLRQIRFELFMSREEFETTRERLTGGRYNKALEGRWMSGKPPFGYNIHPNTRKLEINEEQAKVVRLLFDLFVNGIPDPHDPERKINVRHRALATYLASIGLKTPNGRTRWRAEILQHILTNEVYIGRIIYRRTETLGDGRIVPRPSEDHVIVENAHEQIIDFDTWLKAQSIQSDSKPAPHIKPHDTVYELTGLCVCKICGLKMVMQQQNSKYTSRVTGQTKIFHKQFLVCNHTRCSMLKYELVVAQLAETLKYLRDLTESGQEIEHTLASLVAEKKQEASLEDIRPYVERRQGELKARMKFIREKYELGKYDDEEFEESRSEIRAEQEKLDQMLLNYEKHAVADKPVVDVSKVRERLGTAYQAFSSAVDTRDKNAALSSVFEKVYVERTEKGRGTIPSKFIIYPVLKYSFLYDELLDV